MNKNPKNIIVTGGGASGMLSAGFASQNGNRVILIEKNDKLGKKLYITGKGRCNMSNACAPDEFIGKVPGNPHFLYSSIYGFPPESTVNFFQSLGLKTKTERGGRVFPASGKASDVINALKRHLQINKAEVILNTCVTNVLSESGKITGVKASGKTIPADAVIIATGGLSYPSTGSTGDGYKFAKALGHSITKLSPSLVSLKVKELVKELQGLSLKNIELSLYEGKKILHKDFGEMLFTENGISGPVVLSASRGFLDKSSCVVSIDLKPALSHKELDARVLRDFSKYSNKDFINCLDDLLPRKLIPYIVGVSGISPSKKVNSITKEERSQIVYLLKGLKFTVCGTGGYDEAVITAGGVSTSEINPATMESKLVKGLYFAGEVIDVDGYTGGFNLQIAFSTGYLAGINAGGV